MSTQKLDEAAILKTASERNEFLNLHEVVAKARQNLDQNAWDYIVGGVEYALDMHWSVKAEYLLLGVQKNIQSCAQVGGFPAGTIDCTTTHVPGIQTISLGLNYRFH